MKDKLWNEKISGISLALLLLFSTYFSSLPLVSAAYTVENPYMPLDSDDWEPVCAMKTRADGYFYVPNIATDLLKIELLFDDSGIEGDQAGGISPYDTIQSYPDGKVETSDLSLIGSAWGTHEGETGWNYMADIAPTGHIGTQDLGIIGRNWGNIGTYITDLSGVTVTFNTGEEISPDSYGFLTIPQGATSFTVKRYGNPIGAMIIFLGTGKPPIAYSTTFEFNVPDDVQTDQPVHYYVLAKVYVPSGLSGQNFYFVATADDGVQNVKLNGVSKAGSGSPVNINLRTLSSSYYHLLEFEFVDVSGGGSLNFHVATATGQYAWLTRFRIYVPNFSDNEYRYTVETHTYFPIDYFFLGGLADDFIGDVYLDNTFLMWRDWEWDSKPGAEGDIFNWDFMYPLGQLSGWHDINFTFGEIWCGGLLDFQYLSRTWQQDRIGNPKFWTKIYPPTSSYLTIYDVKAWAGSKWDSIPGSRQRFTAGIRVLANTTDTETFYPAPQEAEVSLFLDVPGPPWDKNSYQDIGVYINLTYTYYIEGSVTYGMPIWFEPYLISVNVPTQDYMLYIPTPSIVYSTQSERSFVSPEWKVAVATSYAVLTAFLSYLYTPVGAGLQALYTYPTIYNYLQDQQLNSTQEYLGPPTSRNYTMNAFKTTKDQIPLSPVVSSVCSAYFFRVWAFSPTNAGGVTVDLHGRLWLPFFYKNPQYEYGTWLPIDIEICTVFPVFIVD